MTVQIPQGKIRYAVYLKETGQIVSINTGAAKTAARYRTDTSQVVEVGIDETISPVTHYVDLETKLVLPKQDYTLQTLPLPCDITVEGITQTIVKQPTRYNFNSSAEYVLMIEPHDVRYLLREFTVNV